jgi:spermidine synthase
MKKTVIASCLLFFSGMCALVYQIAWFREFRLIFGVSTAASAAVLSIFMGGLGLGGLIIGKRADLHPHPLRLYGKLEITVAISTALSPFLIYFIKMLYIWLGGTENLGITFATLLRLILSALVLGLPTFFMGGTFPAAVRSIEDPEDIGRRRLAIIYGCNTIGAVTGAALCTFYLLEILGVHRTLWCMALINIVVGMIAIRFSRQLEKAPLSHSDNHSEQATVKLYLKNMLQNNNTVIVLIAACLVGFVFFLMEIVWYRMLAPILGGSTYTFGVILIIALVGIGLGGICSGVMGSREKRPSWLLFSFICGLEGLFLIAPYALGDRIAIWASLLTPFSEYSFTMKSIVWSMLAAIVILPTSFIAGIQFPLLIALLGSGDKDVGKHTGMAYAANTMGAIIGSLAGGFGLLPLFGAIHLWQLSAIFLVALCLVSVIVGMVEKSNYRKMGIASLIISITTTALIFMATGPTDAWRHQGIGAGRVKLTGLSQNQIRNWQQNSRHTILWEKDGIESSIAVSKNEGLAFIVNGKVDGHSLGDASTQIMSGLISSAIHQNPKNAFVVGLGTGSTAGWLAAIPSIGTVDVAELEPAILDVARQCERVNHSAMHNPKLHIIVNDAREVLLTTPHQYDLIVSEPSNPYRAGIASLYTVEFYESVLNKLSTDGLFTQWIQAYEVDALTIRTILASLAKVFPYVEIWQTNPTDLMVICARQPVILDIPILRKKLSEEPFQSAMNWVWGVEHVEGFLAHYVANDRMVRLISQQEGDFLNTDDLMLVEFGFARTVGKNNLLAIEEIYQAAQKRNWHRPLNRNSDIDWNLLRICRDLMNISKGSNVKALNQCDQTYYNALLKGDLEAIYALWPKVNRKIADNYEFAIIAESFAEKADSKALNFIRIIERKQPVTAYAIQSRYYFRKGDVKKGIETAKKCLEQFKNDPRTENLIMGRYLNEFFYKGLRDKDMAVELEPVFESPFAQYAFDSLRHMIKVKIAQKISNELTLHAINEYGKNFPWNLEILNIRADASKGVNQDLYKKSRKDIENYLSEEIPRFEKWFEIRKSMAAE